MDNINDIKIYDNFFPEYVQEEINQYLDRPKWSFNGGSDLSTFWHMDDLEQEFYFNTFLFNIICNKLGKKFKVLRVYANGQTSGQCGVVHKDDGEWTFLYYPNKEWVTGFEGQLNFFEESNQNINPHFQLNLEIIKSISYKSNRAILFPSNILHYASPPERRYNGLRKSLAYKMISV